MVFSWLQFAIFMFLIGGLLFAGGPLILSALVHPRAKGGDMGMSYECGMKPHGRAWNQFGISYYVYALLFLAFDVDVLYLFPVSVWYPHTEGMFYFIEVAGFLSVLAIAIIYFWKKGVFTWPRKIS
ncbi:NADH-quinone oxidoreductase subunit A [Desulfovibrio sp. JC010]|uniref:NADH-quinone oxidoreductase subunit A n=1 Tax=Desulfovibrio sp. JC010 TaxID=2593641 RepID=UPI0013D10336|nr:NADH-quinone oxidoreductase subunit A [Desulfovibrio sp. JC010]NDV26417.1 NADH-quinone oxidoreductase subunit A [Desulfovibrio sp. JC010]